MAERVNALAIAAVLFPVTAYASFNAAPCRDFACHFGMIGLLVGVVAGIPISVLIFAGLHLGFRNPERSRLNQALLGGAMGIVVFELSAVSYSLMAVWAKTVLGYREGYPLMAFLCVFVPCAILSALYARSSPRSSPAKA